MANNLIVVSNHHTKGLSGLGSEAQRMDETSLHKIVHTSTVNQDYYDLIHDPAHYLECF